MHLLIFGMGYTGTRLATLAARQAIPVTVVTRRPGEPAPAGVRLAAFDAPPLADATHLVATAAPGEGGDPVLLRHGAAIAATPLRWIGYMSTTGVYGDRGGAWVDEDTAPAPSNDRSRRRVAAEQGWAAAHDSAAVDLFRLAGIYGPGRSPLDDLRAGRGRRVDAPGHAFGRIHRDDIAGALIAAMGQERQGVRVLNGNDDEPAPSSDVIAEAARLLGREPPPLVPLEQALAGMSPMGREFWADNRRVRSQKTQDSLGRRWTYPTYREGLRAILAEEGGIEEGQHKTT